MRNMKDSGIAWIGEIPEGYSLSRLKYFIKFINGYAFDSNEFSTESGMPVIRIGDIATKIDVNQCVKVVPNIKYNSFLAEEHDILLAMSGATFGKTALLHDKTQAYINQRVGIIRSNANNYFNYLFNIAGFFEYLRYTFMGSAQPNISGEDIKNYTFLNLPNKKQIADFLDKKCAEIDKLIELQESMIEKLKEYEQSVITNAVTKGLDPDVPMKDSGIEWIGKIPEGWEVVRIKDIGTYRNGVIYSPEDLVDEENGTLVLRSSNIKDGKLVLEDNVYISATINNNLMVKKGDILICSRNGSKALIGKNAIIDRDINAAFGAFMMIFRCKNPKYTYYILNSEVFAYYLGSYLTSTINQLTCKNFGNMQIIYAKDNQTQQQIADYLDKKCAEIDELIKLKEQKIEKLKEYKKSLIYEYVTGKKEVC